MDENIQSDQTGAQHTSILTTETQYLLIRLDKFKLHLSYAMNGIIQDDPYFYRWLDRADFIEVMNDLIKFVEKNRRHDGKEPQDDYPRAIYETDEVEIK